MLEIAFYCESVLRETWTDQYQRMVRSWKRLQDLGAPSSSASEPEGRDALYHFCQDALHLRDWIIYDQTITTKTDTEREEDLRALFNETSVPLAVCADLAIGTKHLLSKGRSYISGDYGAGHASLTGQGVTIGLPTATLEGSGGGWTQYHWIVEDRWDALDLAAQAVADWDSWLTTQGMPVPHR